MKILIVSDAWHPQINGVVRTLESTTHELEAMGHEVRVVGPDIKSWRTISAPSYPSIKLEFFAYRRLAKIWEDFHPDFFHIATEGPLGWAARNLCLSWRIPFTTCYHTRFPEYLEARVPTRLQHTFKTLSYAVLRRFHAPSSVVMVATQSIEDDLRRRKFRNMGRWSRGVDTNLYQDYGKDVSSYAGLPRPILLYVGRIAVEKNIEEFLAASVPGTKVVIGDGPDENQLKAKYPHAKFLGFMEGEKLGRHYAGADVFVFPSLTDTFGLVLLEACATGRRVACCPAPGPVDIFSAPETKSFVSMNKDIGVAIHEALTLPDNPSAARHFAEGYSWKACSAVFYNHLQAPTPKAVRRLIRLRNWAMRWM